MIGFCPGAFLNGRDETPKASMGRIGRGVPLESGRGLFTRKLLEFCPCIDLILEHINTLLNRSLKLKMIHLGVLQCINAYMSLWTVV